jgi:hypothetical protein
MPVTPSDVHDKNDQRYAQILKKIYDTIDWKLLQIICRKTRIIKTRITWPTLSIKDTDIPGEWRGDLKQDISSIYSDNGWEVEWGSRGIMGEMVLTERVEQD